MEYEIEEIIGIRHKNGMVSFRIVFTLEYYNKKCLFQARIPCKMVEFHVKIQFMGKRT